MVSAEDVKSALERIRTQENPFQDKKFCDIVAKTYEIFIDLVRKKLSSADVDKLRTALIDGNAAATLTRLGQLQREQKLNVEDGDSYSAGYQYGCILVIFFNGMAGPKGATKRAVCAHYLDGGGVRATLEELRSDTFRAKRDADPAKSGTAKAITSHLALLYNTSNELSLLMPLGIELRKLDYYPVLQHYALSRSVISFPLLAHPSKIH